jgi:hypothetical protein
MYTKIYPNKIWFGPSQKWPKKHKFNCHCNLEIPEPKTLISIFSSTHRSACKRGGLRLESEFAKFHDSNHMFLWNKLRNAFNLFTIELGLKRFHINFK